MSKIAIIVAASKNMVIGKNNDLPWNLPTDLKSFKRLTQGHTLIMGRLCWESIPEKNRPLPNRENIVITRDVKYVAIGAIVGHDLESLLEAFKNDGKDDYVIVIGGGQIYKDSFKYADKLYLTQILEEVEGDTYLEGFNLDEWELLDESEIYLENDNSFRFKIFEKLLQNE